MKKLRAAAIFALLFPLVSSGQTTVTPTSVSATTLVAGASAALTGGVALSDATTQGTATWIAGSTKTTGATTLMLKGTVESRLDFPAGANATSEIRNYSSDLACGQVITADATVRPMPFHNCMAMPAWYSPAVVIGWAQQANTTVTYVGPESLQGVRVDHLQLSRTLPAKTATTAALLQKLSRVDIYLDATTHLPMSVKFFEHPDDNANADIAVEVRFADYRSENGMLVPFRIQRLRQNSLNLDITVSSVTVNSGLPDTYFTLQ